MVYIGKSAPFLGPDSNHFLSPVSHDPSRKRFLGKLIGLTAIVGLAPQALAKPVVAAADVPQPRDSAKFAIRPDARAIARRADSL